MQKRFLTVLMVAAVGLLAAWCSHGQIAKTTLNMNAAGVCTQNVDFTGTVKAHGSALCKNNLTAAVAPVGTDDSGDGYAVGSIWVNNTPDPAVSYICLDATVGTAVWTDFSSAFAADEENALTWGDGTQASFIWGFDVSGTDTAITFGNGTINVSTGALQVGGSAVLTAEVDGSTTNEVNTATADSGGTTSGLALTLAGGGIVATSRSGDTVTITGTVPDNYVLTAGDTMTGALVIEHADGVELGKDAATNTAGKVKLWSAGAVDFYTTVVSGTQGGNLAWTLPTADGSASQTLITSGGGALSFSSILRPMQLGFSDLDGALTLYSEQGVTDYTVRIEPNAAMTSNATFYLPADEPAVDSWLTMGADGQIDYTTIANENWQATLARGAVASSTPVCSNSTTALTIGAGIAGIDYKITFDGEDNDGYVTWDEDNKELGVTGSAATKLRCVGGIYGGALSTGYDGVDGQVIIFNDNAGADYTVSLKAADTMTESTTYKLPPAKGAAGTVLTDAAGDGTLSWAAAGGAGTIGGSTGSTDNSILRADGAGGVTLQSSLATLSDLSVLAIAGNATNAAGLSLAEDTSDGTDAVTIQAQAMAAGWTLTLPANDGTTDQVLKTDGSGTTSWVSMATTDHQIDDAASDLTSGDDGKVLTAVYDDSAVGGIDAYTLSLLQFNEGAGNTATDSSTASPHTWTKLDGANQTATNVQTGFGASCMVLDGTGDYLTAPDSDDWYFDGDFTIDFWVRPDDASTDMGAFSQYDTGADKRYWLDIDRASDPDRIGFHSYNGASYTVDFHCEATLSAATWAHVEVVRNGNTWYIFVDGDSKGLTLNSGSYSNAMQSLSALFYVGTIDVGSTCIKGKIDEFRVSKGVARHTSSFTPPVKEYDIGGVIKKFAMSSVDVDTVVVGPASATDNNVPRFDATTGKLIQASGLTVPDIAEDADSDTDDVLSTGFAAGYGWLIVRESAGTEACAYLIAGQTIEKVSGDATFTVTADNASTYNVYWSSTQFVVQNKVGDNKNLRAILLGF